MGLTTQQEVFAMKVSEGMDNSEAYRFAYPNSKKWKDTSVHVNASKLRNSTKVSLRVKELQEELQKKSELTKERILEELETILDATIADYVTLVTREVDQRSAEEIEAEMPPDYRYMQELQFKDFGELSEKQLRAVESIRETRNGIELKLHGKSWTIERICKMLGFDSPMEHKVALEGSVDIEEWIKERAE